jgi:hypothetical protein
MMVDTKEGDKTKLEVAEANNRIIQAAKKHIRAAQIRQKVNYDKKTAVREFQVGEIVHRKNFKQSNKVEGYSQKLGPKYVKTEITGKDGDGYYTRDLTGKPGKYHASHLKPISTMLTRTKAKMST